MVCKGRKDPNAQPKKDDGFQQDVSGVEEQLSCLGEKSALLPGVGALLKVMEPGHWQNWR